MRKEARARVPIFDTTQIGYLLFVNCGYRQRLPSREYSLVQYYSLRKHVHMRDMCSDTDLSNTEISSTENAA